MKQRLKDMHVGRLIHILSHSMRRHNPTEVMENDDLTTMQKHVLKFILLETMHRDLYQKDVEDIKKVSSNIQNFCDTEIKKFEMLEKNLNKLVKYINTKKTNLMELKYGTL